MIGDFYKKKTLNLQTLLSSECPAGTVCKVGTEPELLILLFV